MRATGAPPIIAFCCLVSIHSSGNTQNSRTLADHISVIRDWCRITKHTANSSWATRRGSSLLSVWPLLCVQVFWWDSFSTATLLPHKRVKCVKGKLCLSDWWGSDFIIFIFQTWHGQYQEAGVYWGGGTTWTLDADWSLKCPLTRHMPIWNASLANDKVAPTPPPPP